ncbi:MAG: hypothetical protein QM770_14760 [Tepidisphaeraceae bacterium]
MSSFTLTYPEFKQAYRLLERQSRGGRAMPIVLGVLLIAGFGMVIYLTIVRRFLYRAPTLGSHLSDTMIGMLIAAFVGWRAFDLLEGRYRRAWMGAKSLRASQSVALSGDSIRFTSGSNVRSIPLTNYRRAIETKDVVVLLADTGADVLPKRAIDTSLRETIAAIPK